MRHQSSEYRLMCVLAHPDDETLGTGGILARYSAEGIDTHIVCATRGEMGWTGPPAEYPGKNELGKIREKELLAASEVLGVREVTFLDYIDGALDQADPTSVIQKIAGHLQRVRPQVVVTFDPSGAYGHPDHIAISQFTVAATLLAASDTLADHPIHRVLKLYYFLDTIEDIQHFEGIFGELKMTIDGVDRRAIGWPLWSATAQIQALDYADQVWKATLCHQSQLPGLKALQNLAVDDRRRIWAVQKLFRVYSLVNGGRDIESDLFAGIR